MDHCADMEPSSPSPKEKIRDHRARGVVGLGELELRRRRLVDELRAVEARIAAYHADLDALDKAEGILL